MKKLIIIVSVILVGLGMYKANQVQQVDNKLKEQGYTGSFKTGQYKKKEKKPKDIESTINLGSIIDFNDYIMSYHYFESDKNQISIFEKLNNGKSKDLLISHNDGEKCPITVKGDKISVNSKSEYYQISCEKVDYNSNLIKQGLMVYEEEKQKLLQ